MQHWRRFRASQLPPTAHGDTSRASRPTRIFRGSNAGRAAVSPERTSKCGPDTIPRAPLRPYVLRAVVRPAVGVEVAVKPRGGLESASFTSPRRLFHGGDGGGGGGVSAGPVMRDECPAQGWPSRRGAGGATRPNVPRRTRREALLKFPMRGKF